MLRKKLPNLKSYQNSKFKFQFSDERTDTDSCPENYCQTASSIDESTDVANMLRKTNFRLKPTAPMATAAGGDVERGFGSVFDQLRMLPKATSTYYQSKSSVSSSSDGSHKAASTISKSCPPKELRSLPIMPRNGFKNNNLPFEELTDQARHILRGRFDPRPPGTAASQCMKLSVVQPHRKKRICVVGSRYNVLSEVASKIGFEIVGENDLWNINWSDNPLPQDKICQMRRVQDTYSVFWGQSAPLQKTNHFPGMYEICRKDRLGRNLNRLRRLFPQDYNFFPDTWDLPTEQGDLLSYMRRRKNATFIVKPESGCQGKGIFLLRNPKKLSPFTKCVCQVYVPHPFLINGYKFDQRIYVLITSVDPLRVYIYEEGIARFATVKYETPTDENLEVVYMHLTNYSVNKFSESYVKGGEGSKRKLSTVYKWMTEKGYDVQKLSNAIDEIVVKTLLCAAPTLKHNYVSCFPKKERGCSCFELLGFDILIDSDMNPMLLEVNHSPSFHLDLPVDSEVKTELIKDMFNMVYLGEELSASSSSTKSKNKNKSKMNTSVDSSVGKGKRKKSMPLSPPSPMNKQMQHVESSSDTLPKALKKQFQYENKNKGNFRLIYSSDKPGEFERLMDENYCFGYNSGKHEWKKPAEMFHKPENSSKKKWPASVASRKSLSYFPSKPKPPKVYIDDIMEGFSEEFQIYLNQNKNKSKNKRYIFRITHNPKYLNASL